MVKLPDYRAQRGLNTGSAPLVQTDRSGLRQVGAVGHAVQGAGQEALRILQHQQKRERQKEDFGIAQEYERMLLGMGEDREKLLEQAPADGTGFTDTFMSESFAKRRDEFFQKVPERSRDRYAQVLQTDLAKWAKSTAKIERDRLYENSERVIGEQQNTFLNNISLDANAYDESLASGMSIIDDAPIPEDMKAIARQDWEAAALTALAQKLIADDPESAKKALGGGSEATQVGTWLQGFLQSESGGNWNAWFGNANNTEDLSRLSLGQILKRQDEPGNDAAGLIQIVPGTLRHVMSKYGYSAETKFTPQVQAEMALLLMREKGLNKWLAGDMSDEKFANNVASVWAGLKQANGRGVYDGDGVNKGTQSHGVTVAQLQEFRGLVQKDDKLRAWLGNPKVSNAPAIAAGGGAIDPVFQGMDYQARMKVLNFAEREVDAFERFDEDQQQQAKNEITKTGYDLMLDDQMTADWVEENRDILNVSDYKAFLKSTVPGQSPKRTDPKEYIRLLDLADSDPEQAIDEVRQQYGDDLIAKDVFNKIYSRANANVNRETGNRYESEMRQYVRRMLSPEADAPRSHYSRQLDAAFAFDDWYSDNEGASREDMRGAADAIVGNYKNLRYGRETTEMRPPKFLDVTQPITPQALKEAKSKTILAQKMHEQDDLGLQMTKQELAEEARLLRLWGSTLRE